MRRSLVEVFFVDSLCQLVEVLAPRPDVDARHGDLFDFLKWDIVVLTQDVYKRQSLPGVCSAASRARIKC